jgi:two-component system NtrC family sensor kinase
MYGLSRMARNVRGQIIFPQDQSYLQSGEIEVVKKYGDIPLVECYPAQLNQVFMNLINNAIDALQSQSEQSPSDQGKKQIIIQTERIDPVQVKISFIDNGPGIPPDVYPKFFDPFLPPN